MNVKDAETLSYLAKAVAKGRTIERRTYQGDTFISDWHEFDLSDCGVNTEGFAYRVRPLSFLTQDHVYVAVTKRGPTTNYAVFLDGEEAFKYSCDTVLKCRIESQWEPEQ